jgi:hypothetical protein
MEEIEQCRLEEKGDRRVYEIEEERMTERKNNKGKVETEESPLPSVNFLPSSSFYVLSSLHLFFLSFSFQLSSS